MFAVSQTSDGAYWMQTWLPTVDSPASLLVEELREEGVELWAVTSMNVSDQPEIVEQDEGIAFCGTHGIPLFLADPEDKRAVRGSFPIIGIDRGGIRLIREGHFPGYLFEYLLGDAHVDTSQPIPAKYPLLLTPSREAASKLPAHQLRKEIIARLDGEVEVEADGRWLKKKKGLPRDGLLSHSLAAIVPSALHRFTSRFGMGLGGTGALKSRNKSLFSCLRIVVAF